MDPPQSLRAWDSLGDPIKPGDIVKTLSSRLVLLALPNEANAEDAENIENKPAVVHEIGADHVDVEIITDIKVLARLKSCALKFCKNGLKETLVGGNEVTIGSYVKVLDEVDALKRVQQQSFWLHGMEETCGRTGRIVRILTSHEILVQFAWGPRYFYNTTALYSSEASKVETLDRLGNWMLPGDPGTLIRITKAKAEFETFQTAHSLPVAGRYENLPLKYGHVVGIRLKPFSATKTIKISVNYDIYHVHPDVIEVVDTVEDQTSSVVKIGEKVRLINCSTKVNKSIDLKELFDKVGVLKAISLDSQTQGLLIQVCFSGRTVTLKPVQVVKENDGATNADNSSSELQEIERCEITCGKSLGKGAYGEVKRGTWKQKDGTEKDVAVKQFLPNIAVNAKELAIREAKTQFSMRHPNVITLFGYSFARDLWLVMDFVKGWDLETVIHKDPNLVHLTDERKVRMALNMSSAIAYVHLKGYTHCDIKPNNMMVDSSGKLYICDFGVSRYFHQGNGGNINVMITQYTSNMRGTLYYIAPECLQCDSQRQMYKAASSFSDVWSLGMVLYELFTGKMMAKIAMPFMIEKAAMKDAIVKASLQNVPDFVRPMISQALEYQKSRRPTAQTLSEFFQERLYKICNK